MVVDRQGIRPADSKIAAVADLPPPSTVEELKSISRHDRILGAVCRALQHNSLASDGYPSQQSLCCFQTVVAIPDPVAGATAASVHVPQVSSYFLSYSRVPSMGQSVCVAHRCQCAWRGRGANIGLRGGRAGRRIRQPTVVSNGLATRRYRKGVYGGVVGSSPLPPLLAGRQFTLFTECSALTWLFRSRDLDPKLYR